MNTDRELRKLLLSLDRRPYPAYRSLEGSWRFPSYTLCIDHVQGDPFASPSHLTAKIPLETAAFPKEMLSTYERRIAVSDRLLRNFGAMLKKASFEKRGSGKSGLLTVTRPGQEILKRSACEVGDKCISVRFHVGFPAAGRTILAGELETILFQLLPPCIEKSFLYRNLSSEDMKDVISLADDQKYLREKLREEELVAFIGDGSVLPRESGVSDRPMKGAITFTSPESLAVSFRLPSGRLIRGMGIKKGVTLIAGGGYHGKSTLLKAIERGVYDHVRGDGREYVITDDSAVKLRAEDGRKITDTDISCFINDLPNKTDTSHFSTLDASGSTSQAANISEAIEAECRLFLIDEDTSATNFMIRDELMQRVVSGNKEPITPFIERVRQLYEKAGISSIIVVGSSGAYFYPADRVIQMDEYRPYDISEKVKKIVLSEKENSPSLYAEGFHLPCTERAFHFLSDPSGRKRQAETSFSGRQRGKGRPHEHMKIRLQGDTGFSLDSISLDLRYLEQLVDPEQTAALAYLLRYAMEEQGGFTRSRKGLIDLLFKKLDSEGFDFLFGGRYTSSGLALPRKQELFFCFLRV